MPVDATSRKKRTTIDPTPAPDGDHRKRRRNRTTQSCLNCHASKRMCDRKRPACQRCTTLGLSGLCVYEVDDPNQRDNQQDEKITLRNRVAELEGVIREMKNKPHPRWIQKMTIGEDGSNKWNPRARADSTSSVSQTSDIISISSPSDTSDCSPNPTPGSECGDPFVMEECAQPTPLLASNIRLSILSPTPVSTPTPESNESSRFLRPPSFLRSLSTPSPSSTPSPNPPSSPNILPASPGGDMIPQINIAGSDNNTISCFEDMTSLLASTSFETSGYEDGIYGHILDQIMRSDEAKSASAPFGGHVPCGMQFRHEGRPVPSHCGCLETTPGYNAVLELSVRLRKSAETLARLSHHGHGAECSMYSKIAELDSMASNTLNSTPTPSDRINSVAVSAYSNNNMSTVADHSVYNRLAATHCGPLLSTSTITPQYLQNWDHVPGRSNAPPRSSEEDPFMSWDGAHRVEWPPSAM